MVDILHLQCFCPPMVFQFPSDCSSTSTSVTRHCRPWPRIAQCQGYRWEQGWGWHHPLRPCGHQCPVLHVPGSLLGTSHNSVFVVCSIIEKDRAVCVCVPLRVCCILTVLAEPLLSISGDYSTQFTSKVATCEMQILHACCWHNLVFWMSTHSYTNTTVYVGSMSYIW